jgi:hypothetical protein
VRSFIHLGLLFVCLLLSGTVFAMPLRTPPGEGAWNAIKFKSGFQNFFQFLIDKKSVLLVPDQYSSVDVMFADVLREVEDSDQVCWILDAFFDLIQGKHAGCSLDKTLVGDEGVVRFLMTERRECIFKLIDSFRKQSSSQVPFGQEVRHYPLWVSGHDRCKEYEKLQWKNWRELVFKPFIIMFLECDTPAEENAACVR